MPGMDTQQPIQPDTLKDYISTKILPALDASGRTFSLEPVSCGSRNLIWFLTVAGGGRYVLKAVSKRFRIKNIIWAHAHLERRSIPVPKLFFANRAWKTAEDMGYYFACEERVEGTPLDELGAGRRNHIAQAAALFARMHAARSFRWGKLKSFQVLGFILHPPFSSSLSLDAKDDVKDGTENAKDDVVTRDTTSNLKHVQPLTPDTDASASGGERGEAGGTDC